MAKRQRNQLVTVSFHYLVKSVADDDGDERQEIGFTAQEFSRVLTRLGDTTPLDDNDDEVIRQIKLGHQLPFTHFEEADTGLFFGDFEGAYYGQRYRNNRLGVIDPESLNLRPFHYLITRLRDGKILIGTSYHGTFGDYGGLCSCISYLLRGNYRVASKTLASPASEIGSGEPVSVKLTYRRAASRPERRPLFGSGGVVAITSSDFGDGFGQTVADVALRATGTVEQRKRELAAIVNQGELISLDENDIIGCTAVVREEGGTRTVYIIGENNHSTKFNTSAAVSPEGVTDRDRVKSEMIRVLRSNIMPMM